MAIACEDVSGAFFGGGDVRVLTLLWGAREREGKRGLEVRTHAGGYALWKHREKKTKSFGYTD